MDRKDLVSKAVESWDDTDRVDAVYEAGLECAEGVLEDDLEDSEGLYALYRWDDAYTISLASRWDDPKFQEHHPGLELLETYEAKSWREAVNYLDRRMTDFYVPNDPLNDD